MWCISVVSHVQERVYFVEYKEALFCILLIDDNAII